LTAPLMGVCRVIACVAAACGYPVRRGGECRSFEEVALDRSFDGRVPSDSLGG
jgi:hypothetical protein